MAERSNRVPTPSLRHLAAAPDAPIRLVCFPHAGGSATFYAALAHALGPQVDTQAVQYPGRLERRDEPFSESIAEVADAVVSELASCLDRPTALFGHSMGAVVAFEVARRLAALQCPPTWLFISGRGAPFLQPREFTHLLDDQSLLAEMAKLGGTDRRLLADEELMQFLLPVIRGDYRTLASYRHAPGSPLSCPLTAVNGQDDPRVSTRTVAAWEQLTTGPFHSLTLRGGHFYLVERAPEVAALIRGCLTDAPRYRDVGRP